MKVKHVLLAGSRSVWIALPAKHGLFQARLFLWSAALEVHMRLQTCIDQLRCHHLHT